MRFISFLMATNVCFNALFAEAKEFPGDIVKYQKLECLYVNEEQIILEDGSVWIPEEMVFINQGDLVEVEGWYVHGDGSEIVERNFIIDGNAISCSLDSFVQIEKVGIEKSHPFQIKVEIHNQGQVNKAFLGGQIVRTSGNELLFWIEEGLKEQKISQGKEILIIKNEKEQSKILHTANGEWMHGFYRIGKVGDPILRKVVSVTNEGVDFEPEYTVTFDLGIDPQDFQAAIKEMEECPIEEIKMEISSFNPFVFQFHMKTKEGQSVVMNLSTDNQCKCDMFVEDINEELTVEVEFLADRELAEAFECAYYRVGDEFLTYPLTFYPIAGAEEFFGNLSEILGAEINLTDMKDLYLLERVQK